MNFCRPGTLSGIERSGSMDLLQVAVTAVGAFAALFLLSKLMATARSRS